MSANKVPPIIIFYKVLTLPVALPMMLVGRLLFTASVFLVWGSDGAREAWRDTR